MTNSNVAAESPLSETNKTFAGEFLKSVAEFLLFSLVGIREELRIRRQFPDLKGYWWILPFHVILFLVEIGGFIAPKIFDLTWWSFAPITLYTIIVGLCMAIPMIMGWLFGPEDSD